MAKKNKWDEFLQFDDWKEDDNLDEIIEEEKTVELTAPREIQGLGIKKHEEDFDLSSMIAGLNAQNEEYVASSKENEISSKNERKRAEQQAEEEARAAKAKAIFEKEQAEKEARMFAEQEAEAKRIAEELEKKQNSFLNKAGKALFGKNQKQQQKQASVQTSDNDNLTKEIEEKENLIFETNLIEKEDIEENKNAVNDTLIVEDEKTEMIGNDISNSSIKGKEEKIGERKKKDSKDTEDKNVNSDIEETTKAVSLLDGSEDNSKEIDVEENEDKDKNSKEKQDKRKPSKKEKEITDEKADSQEQKDKKSKFPFLRKKDSQKLKSSEKEKKEPDWKYVATHDEMTGLWNRTAYEQAKSEKRDYPYAIIYIDVNNLKYANDTIGHEAGDALIKAVSSQIDHAFPEDGYRIGGDEFVVILEDISFKKANDILSKKRNEFHKELEKMSKSCDIKGLVFSASFGFSYTDGSKSFSDVSKEAEKAMYKEKEMYKKAHPQYDMRGGNNAANKNSNKLPDKQSKPTSAANYDEMLTKEQRELKQSIKDGHVQVSTKSTQDIMMEIQRRATEIVAILIASPTFDHLFIIQTAATFIDIVMESDYLVDYSYLYIVYTDCPVYKGSDEYLEEVTTLFNAIGQGFKTGRIQSEKDLLKIKGINIFKNIYVDA